MKRSERIRREAARERLTATGFLSAASAAGVWAVVAGQSGNVPGGTGLMLSATIALIFARTHFREAARLARLAGQERERWEVRL